ncbi:MAG: diguanylate cyclase domain-containing protein, partial [Mycobacteriales bacterium]
MSSDGPAAGTVTASARRSRWLRWAGAVVVVNVTVGMCFSVVLLRHQADDRRTLDVLLTRLDAQASTESALLWQALAGTGSTSAPSSQAADALAQTAAQVRSSGSQQTLGPLFAALRDYQTQASDVRKALEAGQVGSARALATDGLAPATSTLQSASTRAVAQHKASSQSTGRIADGETVFMMLFAALMSGLLFRRFHWARRSADVRAAQERARSEARFRALVHHSSDLVTVTDADTTILFQTPSLRRILGYDPEELAGSRLVDLAHPDDRLRLLSAHDELAAGRYDGGTLSFRLRHQDGSWRHVESVASSLLDEPEVRGIVVNTRDVTDRVLLEDKLTHSAFHDPLTSLANRALFSDRLSHALTRNDRRQAPLAVLFFDLDDFKAVNDELGHAAGDELLVAVAARLRECVRTGDTLARLGGDEFALLVEDAPTEGDATAMAARAMAALDAPFTVHGHEVNVRASIGVALASGASHDASDVLRDADIAMYAAKRDGKAR